MGFHSVVSVLALAAVAFASVNDNALGGGERVYVAPVLAPPRETRTHVTDRSRQFPILVLLTQGNPQPKVLEPQAKSLDVTTQPIYVQQLQDQERPVRANRQKRHLKKLLGKLLGLGGISFGGGFGYGGGGEYECRGYGGYNRGYGGHGGYGGQGGYGGHGGYQEPTKTIVVKVVKEHGNNFIRLT